jgi:hypothetical protein
VGHFGALNGTNMEKSEWKYPDSEPHQRERLDPDQSEKQDPDQHQSDSDPQH